MEEMQPRQLPRKSSGCGLALGIGCGSVALLLLIFGILIAFNWRKIATWPFRNMVRVLSNEAPLTPEEKNRITASLDRIWLKFEEDKLGMEEIRKLEEIFQRSPLSKAFPLLTVKIGLKSSGLSADEKTAGARSVDRLLRAVAENQLSSEEWETLAKDLPFEADKSKQFKFDNRMNDVDLREFSNKAKALADSKTIADEDFKYDFAGEVEKFVNQGLGEEIKK